MTDKEVEEAIHDLTVIVDEQQKYIIELERRWNQTISEFNKAFVDMGWRSNE